MLEVAGKLFASRGFNGVSTRELTRAARVNLSSITYHFGGKKGLYHEVLRRLIADTGRLVGPIIERLNAGVVEASGDRAALARLTRWFVRNMISAFLGDPQVRWQMALVLREFQEPSSEFPMLLRERINPLHDAVAELVAAATGRGPRERETVLLTHALIGQIMGFGTARTVLWARLEWDGYTPERLELVIATVTPTVLAMLGLAQAGEGKGR